MIKGVDYIGVGVGAIILNDENKVFLAKRSQNVRNEKGKWEAPGGGVKFGETLQDALKREMKEEYGIAIEVIELLDVCDHIIPEDKQHWVSPTYICKIINGAPQIIEPHKCEAIGWFSIEEAEKMDITIVTKFNLKSLRNSQTVRI